MEKQNENDLLEYISFPKSNFSERYKFSIKNKHKQVYFLTGFTLIELLVVISIIALLLAILMPSLQRARKSARAVVCQSHLKGLGTAFASNIEENDGCLPKFDTSWRISMWDIQSPDVDEVRYKNIRFCPMAVKPGNRPYPEVLVNEKYITVTMHIDTARLGSAFEAWIVGKDTDSASYGLSCGVASSGYWPKVSRGNKGLSIYSLKGQSNIPVLLDSASHLSIFLTEDRKPPATEEEEISCCINRHDGGVNCLFMDWSVRKVGLKELWKLKWHPEFNTNGPWTKAGGVKPEDWPEWMREFKDY